MNSRLPGMCKRSLQVCREQLQDCWITVCHSLPSPQFGYIEHLNLWKKNAVVHSIHVFVILNIDIMKKGVLNNFECVSLMFL